MEAAVADPHSEMRTQPEKVWRTAEAAGATVEEAIRGALAQLGVDEEHAVVEVLSRPSEAVPGESISASGEARVRITEVDDRTRRARDLIEELLAKMEIPARVAVRAPQDGAGQPIIDVSGDDLGLLIGWRGETLRSLQTVVNLMLGEEEPEQRRVIVDVERYRARREEQVKEMALRVANRVKRSGQRFTMDPMQSYERRAVHLALASDEGVRTESAGKDPARRIVVHPTGPAQPDLPEYPAYGDRPRGEYGDRGGRGGRDRDRGPRRPRW